MRTPKAKEALCALALMTPTIVGYSFETAVKAGVHSTRDEVATIAQGIELNSYIWGNGSLDPTNYWTHAMQERER